jgi:hypothetical protein
MFQRPHRHIVFLPEKTPRLMVFHMDPFMEDFALRGKTVLFPYPLKMNQRILSIAKQRMLQRGNRD